MFKQSWERHHTPVSLSQPAAQTLINRWKNIPIQQLSFLSNGCANSNYKIEFLAPEPPVVLRLYTRKTAAMLLEKNLSTLVEDMVPTAKFLYSHDTIANGELLYAILEWKEGSLMRDILLQGDLEAINECAKSAAKQLATLAQLHYPTAGFFKADLSIAPFSEQDAFKPYLLELLNSETLHKQVNTDFIKHLERIIIEFEYLYTDLLDQTPNLIHGDYDPANILVIHKQGQWQISAILDWEFARADSYLLDIGQMLRFAHRMPDCYTTSFIHALQDNGVTLAKNWPYTTKFVDLLNLIPLLHRNPVATHPRAHQDIVALLKHTVEFFNRA